MRIGPRMQMAIDYVGRHDGCCKWDVAKAITPLSRYGLKCECNNALGYNPINRAIRAGLIRAKWDGHKYSLSLRFV